MPEFARQPLLPVVVEKGLVEELKIRLSVGDSARSIARDLGFGDIRLDKRDKDGKVIERFRNPAYNKLKIFHVWLYREKYNKQVDEKNKNLPLDKQLPLIPRSPRAYKNAGIKKGESRYKHKREDPMSFTEFRDILNKNLPFENRDSIRKQRAFLILGYWCVLRKSEIYERKRKDFSVKNDLLTITLYRKKKYYRVGSQPEPFPVPLGQSDKSMLNEVVEWIDTFGDEEYPFKMSSNTAWIYVRDVFPGLYPHFWRGDWITKGIDNADDPAELLRKLLKDTGLDIRTISYYIMKNTRHQAEIGRTMLEKELTASA